MDSPDTGVEAPGRGYCTLIWVALEGCRQFRRGFTHERNANAEDERPFKDGIDPSVEAARLGPSFCRSRCRYPPTGRLIGLSLATAAKRDHSAAREFNPRGVLQRRSKPLTHLI
jgi:hypothetical protein